MPAAPRPRPARLVRWAKRLALASLIGFVLLEGGLRLALFHGLGPASLRRPDLYADRTDPFHWELRTRLRDPDEVRNSQFPHPGLGWISGHLDATTLDHVDAPGVGARRPVLLYGDSFVECAAARDRCWQHLLEESELGATHALLNHGVGGYGLDQAVMLLASTLDRYRDQDPLVLLGILVDDDLDRCVLRFRGWPKPWFELLGETELELHRPDTVDVHDWLGSHPLPEGLLSWRFLLHGSGLVPEGRRRAWSGLDERVQDTRLICGRLLRRARNEARARGLDFGVVLFHGRPLMERENPLHNWRHGFLRHHLEAAGIPYVSSLVTAADDRVATGREPADYFQLSGVGRGHYHAAGNEVLFPLIEDAVEGRWHGPE